MDFKEFSETIKDKIQDKLGEQYQINTDRILKNNSQHSQGLVINKEGNVVSPTIYLEYFYEQYSNGLPIEEVVEEILLSYGDAIKKQDDYNDIDSSFEGCKDNIIYRLISKEKNLELLKTIPYMEFCDLAIIFCTLVSISNNGIETIKITNSWLEQWGIEESKLFDIACENTLRLFPVKKQSIFDIVKDYIPEEAKKEKKKSEMIVLTNDCGVNGASVILYKNVLEMLSSELNSDLFILPSSIHETIIIKDNKAISREELKNMVYTINRSQVSEEDYLSDSVYHFSLKDKCIRY